jgi:penicillin-binding protein 2
MDVNTGEILAMASYPSYDPSVYLEGADNKEAQKKIQAYREPKDKISVLLNRVTRGLYTPGSTFKPLASIAALEEGVIKPDTPVNDPGYYVVDGYKFKCLEFKTGHGDLDLKHALETSCNIYFEKVGYGRVLTNRKMGKDVWAWRICRD